MARIRELESLEMLCRALAYRSRLDAREAPRDCGANLGHVETSTRRAADKAVRYYRTARSA